MIESPLALVAVYDKHDYLTERRNALELWSAKIAGLEKGEAFKRRAVQASGERMNHDAMDLQRHLPPATGQE